MKKLTPMLLALLIAGADCFTSLFAFDSQTDKTPLSNQGNTITDTITTNLDIAPPQYTGITGSVGHGAINAVTTRSGGYGSYGNILSNYTITAPVRENEYDIGITSWVTSRNLTTPSASLFGMWSGANTPSSFLGQTFKGGSAIGMEINVGNRWSDFGLQPDVGGTHYTEGLQIVPDVLPSSDGPTAVIYPGTFALVIGPSVHGHKWWTGSLIRPDTIMPGGNANRHAGGSTASNAPHEWTGLVGFWETGLDLSSAFFSSYAIKGTGFNLDGSGNVSANTVTAPKVCLTTNICWTSGPGAPASSTCTSSTIGSFYSNTSGGSTTTFYVCTADGTWTSK